MRRLFFNFGLFLFGILIAIGIYILYSFISRPTVSVIISTYNMSETLPKAIDSILAQTFSDWELIVIDDGSIDNTKDVLKFYQNQDKRIRVIINEKNIGLPSSLNKGLSIARGKYIVRLDADDTSYPNRLARQVSFMEKYNLDLAGANFDTPQTRYKFKLGKSVPTLLDSNFLVFHLFISNVFTHSTVIFRKKFLDKHHLIYNPERPNAEDYDLWLQMFLHGGKLAIMGGVPVTTYKSSGHSEHWWKISDNSVRTSKKLALQKIIPDFSDNMLDLPSCDFLRLIAEENKKTKILNEEKFAIFIKRMCF